jgi:hypothetical protein
LGRIFSEGGIAFGGVPVLCLMPEREFVSLTLWSTVAGGG